MEKRLLEIWVNGIFVGDDYYSIEEAQDEIDRICEKNDISDDDRDVREYDKEGINYVRENF